MNCFTSNTLEDKLEDSIKDLEPVIIDIANRASDITVVTPDIEDDQKRWLIVGICLHSVVSPALRQFVQPAVSKLYYALKQSDQIHTQIYAKHLKRYKKTNRVLNYEAINNNSSVPKIRGKKDVQNYDYRVCSDVDLSKLFMLTNMAHYTGFDDTCDASALLGMIINMDIFPAVSKAVAEMVRSDVRNPWAHCNFPEWDVIKYQTSFHLMRQLIQNLLLPVHDETSILGMLSHWETNGIQFLHGTTLGIELVRELKTETSAISKYLIGVVTKTGEVIQEICDALISLEDKFNEAANKINNLEQDSQMTARDVKNLTADIEDLKVTENQHSTSVEELTTELNGTNLEVAFMDTEVEGVMNSTDVHYCCSCCCS